MRLIRKLYWIAVVVMMVMGFPYEGSGEFITSLCYYFFFGIIFLYAAPKVLHIGSSGSRRSRAGSLRSSMIGGMEQGTSRMVTNFMMSGTGRSSGANQAALRRQEEKARRLAQYQAKNEAIFQENQAKKMAGTYAGHQAHNRALAARNRAKNL